LFAFFACLPAGLPPQVFKFVLQYLRARASCSDAVVLPGDESTRQQLRSEARYFGLPCLESLLEAPNGSFNDVYMQQSSALDRCAGTAAADAWLAGFRCARIGASKHKQPADEQCEVLWVVSC
jgi:hypothetical protein